LCRCGKKKWGRMASNGLKAHTFRHAPIKLRSAGRAETALPRQTLTMCRPNQCH
jgi:hypothetical protein